MNIRDILKAAGYEVLEEKVTQKYPPCRREWRYWYKVRYSLDRIKLVKSGEYGCYEDPETLNAFNVIVGETGFNGYGDLYLILHQEGKEDETWDCIEFSNGRVEI